MGKQIVIMLFAALLLFSSEALSQKKENVVQELSQDDLGNVTDAFQEHFFEALKQKAIENHEKAIKALGQCLALDPSQAVVYLELGKNHNALEQFTQAATYLEKARTAAPANEAVLAELYSSYYHNRDFEKALPVVQELVRKNDTYSEDLANLYLLNGKYDEALDLLDRLDAQWGESAYRNNLRRQVYSRTGDTQGQIEDLQSRLAANPEEEKNYLNLIYVYSEEGNREKAYETAIQLLEAKPDSELVHLALYKFYLTEGAHEEAVKSMKIVAESHQVDEMTKYQALNDFLLFVTQNPELESDLVEIVDLFSEDENNNKVYGQLGAFFLEKGKKEQALSYFEKALENEQGAFGLYKNVLLLQMDAGKFEDAVKLGEEAVESFPSQPLLYLFYATALNQTGAYAKAEDMLTFGLDFVIDDKRMEADFYRQLAVAYEGLKEESKAADFQKKAAQLEKDNNE